MGKFNSEKRNTTDVELAIHWRGKKPRVGSHRRGAIRQAGKKGLGGAKCDEEAKVKRIWGGTGTSKSTMTVLRWLGLAEKRRKE